MGAKEKVAFPVGTKIENGKSIYTILGDNGLKSCNKKYLVSCSICSSDPELFPEIWARKGDLLAHKLSCGCATHPSYSKEQYETMCRRKCYQHGVTFLGLIETSVRPSIVNLKVEFVDRGGNLMQNMSVSYFLYRYDPSKASTLIKCDNAHYEHKLRYLFPQGTKFNRIGRSRKFMVYCPICSENMLCRSGITSTWFESTYSNLLAGCKPCFCSGHYQYSALEYKARIIESMDLEDVFIDFTTPFIGNKTKFAWKCKCGYIHTQAIADFLSGKRCPSCSRGGFNYSKPGVFYVAIWNKEDDSFIKVGVTNRGPETRFEEQKKSGEYNLVSYKIYHFDIGYDAKKVEDLVLSKYPRKTNEIRFKFEDGKTEIIDIKYYDELTKIMETYDNQYCGEREEPSSRLVSRVQPKCQQPTCESINEV